MEVETRGCYCKLPSWLSSDVQPSMIYSPLPSGECWKKIYIGNRILGALYVFTIMLLTWVRPEYGGGIKWLIFLTHWSYLLLSFSLILRAAITIYFYYKYRNTPVNAFNWCLRLSLILYSCSATMALVVTLLFWVLLYYPGYPLLFEEVHMHGLNAVYIWCIDFSITAMPVRILHIWAPLMFALVYSVFSVIYDLSGGTNTQNEPYIYAVMNWSEGAQWPTAYAFGSFVVLGILYFLLFGLYKGKLALYNKLCRTVRVQSADIPMNEIRSVPDCSVTVM